MGIHASWCLLLLNLAFNVECTSQVNSFGPRPELPQGDRTFAEIAIRVAALMLARRRATHEFADTSCVTGDDIVELQRVLMSDDSKLIGIRSQQNWVGGNNYHALDAEFVPPASEGVGPLKADLVGYTNTGDHAPLVQAAVVHAQFETINPF